jgi:hypothetical protein
MVADTSVVLAIWNDIELDRVSEYEAWHTLEHVPERVWVPGFTRGNRYVAVSGGQPRYLTLYDIVSFDPLMSEQYIDLVEHPTAWTASMRPAFKNFLRQPCELVASAGHILGGWTLTVRFALAAEAVPAQLQAIAQGLFVLGTTHSVTHVRIGRVRSAGPQALANVQSITEGNDYLLLIQSATEEGASNLRTLVDSHAANLLNDALYRVDGLYRLASRTDHVDVQASERPTQRIDLMSQFHSGVA